MRFIFLFSVLISFFSFSLGFGFSTTLMGAAQQVQPWLGVEIDPAPQKEGILVKRVIPNTPAERAGFEGGDILKAIDKEKIRDREGLMEILRNKGVGTTVKVHFTRKNKSEIKDLKLEILPDMLDLARANLVKKRAMDFELVDVMKKKVIKNSDLKGKPYILEFWATWCPACRAAAPHISRWAKAHPGIPVIGISDEDPEIIKAFTEREKLSYIQTHDKDAKAQTTYGMGSIPAFILVDKDGVIVDLTVGVGDYLGALLKKAESL